MDTAKLFFSGGSQSVRLPRAYRLEGEEVCVARVGEMVILYPPGRGWALLERGISQFTDDYMRDRDQPPAAEARPGA